MTKARIIESNHTRALYTFELCEGEIGYLEVLDNNELEVDDVLTGDFSETGNTVAKRGTTKILISIEDFCDIELAKDMID